jgi:hypothetical protein
MESGELAFKALTYHMLMEDERRQKGLPGRFYPAGGFFQLLTDEENHARDEESNRRVFELGVDRAVAFGETFAVATPMLQIAEYASRTLPETWVYKPSLLLAEAGVAYFEAPITLADRTIHGFVWCAPPPEGALVVAVLYKEHDDDAGHVHMNGWLWSEGDGVITPDSELEPDADEVADNRLIAALFELIHQRIGTQERPELSRAARRGAAPWRPVPQITVITLRRTKTRVHDGDSAPQEWSCQWMVESHWRHQYGPVKYADTGGYFDIYIHGHAKGPKDKPLRLPGTKVKALIR